MENNDNIIKLCIGVFVSFMSWAFYGVRQNTKRHEKSNNAICELQRKSAVAEEQMKHVLAKLDDVIDLGADLKKSNNIILKTLARKAKGQ